MSAFIIGPAHVSALLRAWRAYAPKGYAVNNTSAKGQPIELHHDAALSRVGQELMDANATSHAYCWGEPLVDVTGYRYGPDGRVPSPVEALKLIDSSMCQSRDHPAWSQSDAKAILEAAQAICIQALPGYANAPWEWTDRHDQL